MLPESVLNKLNSLVLRKKDLEDQLSSEGATEDISKFTSLNKEYSEIKDVVENWNRYQELEASIEDLDTLAKDEEMKSLALEEKDQNLPVQP